jgi:hypothetical protein
MKLTSLLALASVAIVLASAPASATTLVYTTFCPHHTFGSGGLCADGPAEPMCHPNAANYSAAPFVPSASGTLNHLDVAITNWAPAFTGGLAKGATVALVADENGLPAVHASALEEWVIGTLPLYPVQKSKALVSKRLPALVGGTRYWLVVMPGGFDGFAIWNDNLVGVNNMIFSVDGGSTWAAAVHSATFDVWIN